MGESSYGRAGKCHFVQFIDRHDEVWGREKGEGLVFIHMLLNLSTRSLSGHSSILRVGNASSTWIHSYIDWYNMHQALISGTQESSAFIEPEKKPGY